MSKKLWSVLAAGALVASLFTALPANAAPEVPADEDANIVDPLGDANFFEEDLGLGSDGNVSNVGDLQKIWFTNDADTVSVHILTTAPPPAGSVGNAYEVLASPGEGPVSNQANGCLSFRVVFPAANAGGTYQGDNLAKVRDRCNEGTSFYMNGAEGEVLVEALDDGSGVTTLTFPRSYSSLLADAATLSEPRATSTGIVGTDQVDDPETGGPFGAFGIVYDSTDIGTDYTITGEGDVVSEPPVMEEPPVVQQPKKKNCKKIQNKKKRKKCIKRNKKFAKPQGCPAYVPGEEGAEAETTTITNEHTEEAPLELTIEQEPGLGNDLGLGAYDQTAEMFHNIQIDSAESEVGLYIRYEFPLYEDHDLYVNYADGSEAAHVGGFNMTPIEIFDGTGSGGHSEQGAEQIDGLRTSDCAGYTLRLVNWLGEGGEYTVKFWFGEIQNDPAPPE